MNKAVQTQNTKFIWLFRLSVLVVAGFVSTSTFAANRLPDIIALLSEAKAKAEGRASRVQACLATKDPKLLSVLIAQYDDARNPFNGRIDGWIVGIRTQHGKALEESLEVERLNLALNRIDSFAEAADRALIKYRCNVYKKANWSKVVAIVFTPEMIKVLLDFFRSSSETDKEREEAIRAIEIQKILEWQNVRSIIVFDWESAKFFVADDITADVLAKGSTSVYVNKWALGYKPQRIVLNKSLPDGLSTSYQLYTGTLEDLKRYTGVN